MSTRLRLILLLLVVLAWAAPARAQQGLPNGKQFSLSVTNGAIVHLTVPAGTTYCVIAVSTNPVNYDVGTTASNAAPTTAAGIPAVAGAVISLASFASCKNFGVIAQSGNATLYILYFR